MAAASTIALVSLGVAAAGAGVGAYSAVKQGQFQKAAAEQQANEMEIQMQADKTQRAAEKVDEASQSLDRARQLDSLFREQRVVAASSGLMGGSFAAIQANDLSKYSREQSISGLFSSTRDSNAAMKLDSMKRQIVATRASGNFAQKIGILNAAGGITSAGYSTGMGYAQYKSK